MITNGYLTYRVNRPVSVKPRLVLSDGTGTSRHPGPARIGHDGRPAVSISRQVAAGLHLAIGGTGGTAVDHVAVVSEDAGKLLCDVRTAVSTACAGCRLFHRRPVRVSRVHEGSVVVVSVDARRAETLARRRRSGLGPPRRRTTERARGGDDVARSRDPPRGRRWCVGRSDIILPGTSDVNKGRRLFITAVVHDDW